jgi:hypothetical protein
MFGQFLNNHIKKVYKYLDLDCVDPKTQGLENVMTYPEACCSNEADLPKCDMDDDDSSYSSYSDTTGSYFDTNSYEPGSYLDTNSYEPGSYLEPTFPTPEPVGSPAPTPLILTLKPTPLAITPAPTQEGVPPVQNENVIYQPTSYSTSYEEESYGSYADSYADSYAYSYPTPPTPGALSPAPTQALQKTPVPTQAPQKAPQKSPTVPNKAPTVVSTKATIETILADLDSGNGSITEKDIVASLIDVDFSTQPSYFKQHTIGGKEYIISYGDEGNKRDGNSGQRICVIPMHPNLVQDQTQFENDFSGLLKACHYQPNTRKLGKDNLTINKEQLMAFREKYNSLIQTHKNKIFITTTLVKDTPNTHPDTIPNGICIKNKSCTPESITYGQLSCSNQIEDVKSYMASILEQAIGDCPNELDILAIGLGLGVPFACILGYILKRYKPNQYIPEWIKELIHKISADKTYNSNNQGIIKKADIEKALAACD